MRNLILGVVIAACTSTVFADEPWYPSKYGSDDTIGAANNLSPAGVLEAAKLVKSGKVYSLGVTTGPDTPAYGTRSFQIFTEASSSARRSARTRRPGTMISLPHGWGSAASSTVSATSESITSTTTATTSPSFCALMAC